jgi:hypothetical protein
MRGRSTSAPPVVAFWLSQGCAAMVVRTIVLWFRGEGSEKLWSAALWSYGYLEPCVTPPPSCARGTHNKKSPTSSKATKHIQGGLDIDPH